MAKYNASCSLTDSPNDAGHCHSNLKRAYDSTDYQEHYSEPLGRRWEKLKARLQASLDTDSFETIWPAVASARSYIGKAFSDFNVQSSYAVTGMYPLNTKTILGRNLHYTNDLSDEQRAYVHDVCLPQLVEVLESEGYIPEQRFQEILSGDAALDNCPPKTRGQPLNLLHTSYQRCVLINSPEYLAHVATVLATKLAKTAPRTAQNASIKQAKKYICFNLECDSVRGDQSTDNWTKCGVPYCTTWSCSSLACMELLRAHQIGDHSKRQTARKN